MQNNKQLFELNVFEVTELKQIKDGIKFYNVNGQIAQLDIASINDAIFMDVASGGYYELYKLEDNHSLGFRALQDIEALSQLVETSGSINFIDNINFGDLVSIESTPVLDSYQQQTFNEDYDVVAQYEAAQVASSVSQVSMPLIVTTTAALGAVALTYSKSDGDKSTHDDGFNTRPDLWPSISDSQGKNYNDIYKLSADKIQFAANYNFDNDDIGNLKLYFEQEQDPNDPDYDPDYWDLANPATTAISIPVSFSQYVTQQVIQRSTGKVIDIYQKDLNDKVSLSAAKWKISGDQFQIGSNAGYYSPSGEYKIALKDQIYKDYGDFDIIQYEVQAIYYRLANSHSDKTVYRGVKDSKGSWSIGIPIESLESIEGPIRWEQVVDEDGNTQIIPIHTTNHGGLLNQFFMEFSMDVAYSMTVENNYAVDGTRQSNLTDLNTAHLYRDIDNVKAEESSVPYEDGFRQIHVFDVRNITKTMTASFKLGGLLFSDEQDITSVEEENTAQAAEDSAGNIVVHSKNNAVIDLKDVFIAQKQANAESFEMHHDNNSLEEQGMYLLY